MKKRKIPMKKSTTTISRAKSKNVFETSNQRPTTRKTRVRRVDGRVFASRFRIIINRQTNKTNLVYFERFLLRLFILKTRLISIPHVDESPTARLASPMNSNKPTKSRKSQAKPNPRWLLVLNERFSVLIGSQCLESLYIIFFLLVRYE